jgi:hypothetical protein
MAKYDPAYAEIRNRIDFTYNEDSPGIDRIHRSSTEHLLLWKVLDGVISKGIRPADHPQVHLLVKNHYRITIWNRLKGDQIENWRIANLLFRMGYTYGVEEVWKVLADSLGNVYNCVRRCTGHKDLIAAVNEIESMKLSDVLFFELKKNFMLYQHRNAGYSPGYINAVRLICGRQ